MLRFFRTVFLSHYNILLVLLFLLFAFRSSPGDGEIYHGIWKTFLTITLIIAIFNCRHKRSVKIAISILAVPTLLLSWINLFIQAPFIFIPVAVCTCLFMTICAGSILYDVLLRSQVTVEILRGVICVYFLVAFIFAYIYLLLEYVAPGTILLQDKSIPIVPFMTFLSQMLYFSFITLLTIGFGDIVPATTVGETFVVFEGIIGQFYLAMLMERLIAVYAFYSNKHLLHSAQKKHSE